MFNSRMMTLRLNTDAVYSLNLAILANLATLANLTTLANLAYITPQVRIRYSNCTLAGSMYPKSIFSQ